eukprot:GHVU01157585.1.p1 GENE.GHVU01157585.1~~GHVU01157585.1.p1  ORF type:complete len:357 (+),score=26.47 GHVU01157585.1:159-1073(+)
MKAADDLAASAKITNNLKRIFEMWIPTVHTFDDDGTCQCDCHLPALMAYSDGTSRNSSSTAASSTEDIEEVLASPTSSERSLKLHSSAPAEASVGGLTCHSVESCSSNETATPSHGFQCSECTKCDRTLTRSERIRSLLVSRGCPDHELDPEERENPYVFLPMRFAKRLWPSTLLQLWPAYVAYQHALLCFALFNFIVFATSCCHWIKPRLGTRRNIDVTVVTINFAVHVLAAPWVAQSWVVLGYFWFGAIANSLMYFIGRFHGSRGHHDVGCWWHVSVHVASIFLRLYLYFRSAAAVAATFAL